MNQKRYRIIIVDDEKTIRDGLTRFINWNELGFEVVGCFGSGAQAAEFLKENDVDVVLTDIRMANMTGLELTRLMRENKVNAKVVFLTGYKDFEYARQAVELDVVHYLLKPTQLPELYEVFEKIKKQLDKERAEKQNINSLKRTLYEQFFLDIFLGAVKSKKNIEEKAAFLKLDIKPDTTYCAVLTLNVREYEAYLSNDYKFGKEQFYTAIGNFVALKYNDIEFVSVYRCDGLMKYILYSEKNMDNLISSLDNTIDEIRALMKLDVDISIEGIYDNVYSLAEKGIEYNFSENKKITDDIISLNQLLEQQKLLMSYILSGEQESALNLLETIINALDNVEVEEKRKFVEYIFNSIEKNLLDLGIDYQPEGYFAKAVGYDEVFDWGISRLCNIIESMKSNLKSSENMVINKAKEYINENYNLDISLEDVAASVLLSPAYFSRTFKKCCDENFSEYLLKLRMTKAMSLLQNTQLKVYEIAERVGFRTLKYFYKIFKQYTGVTPTEYRLRILGRSEDCRND